MKGIEPFILSRVIWSLRGRSFPAFFVRDRADTVDDLTPALPGIRNIPEFP